MTTNLNLDRIRRQAYPGESNLRGMHVPDPPWTPRAMRDDVRALIAEIDFLSAAEQDKAKQLPPLTEEIERLQAELNAVYAEFEKIGAALVDAAESIKPILEALRQ